MKIIIYSKTFFLTAFFLLIFQHIGNAQSVSDLYEKYSNNSQNQQSVQTDSNCLNKLTQDTVINKNAKPLPVFHKRAGEHAPDYDDPDYTAKKAEWIIKYPEEYNKTFNSNDNTNKAAKEEESLLKNLVVLKENEPPRYDMELERIKTVKPEVYKKHLEWLKAEDPERYKIEIGNNK